MIDSLPRSGFDLSKTMTTPSHSRHSSANSRSERTFSLKLRSS